MTYHENNRQVLKEARLGKRYSLVKMENITRIKDFIEALENEDWEAPRISNNIGFKKFGLATRHSENSVVAV